MSITVFFLNQAQCKEYSPQGILIVNFAFRKAQRKYIKQYHLDLFGADEVGSLYQSQKIAPKCSMCISEPPQHLFFSGGGEDYRLGNVLCSQLSELLAGSSLTLITFSSSTLQLADVATNFCHILNLYIVFLARVQLKSVSDADIFIQRWGSWGSDIRPGPPLQGPACIEQKSWWGLLSVLLASHPLQVHDALWLQTTLWLIIPPSDWYRIYSASEA